MVTKLFIQWQMYLFKLRYLSLSWLWFIVNWKERRLLVLNKCEDQSIKAIYRDKKKSDFQNDPF